MNFDYIILFAVAFIGISLGLYGITQSKKYKAERAQKKSTNVDL